MGLRLRGGVWYLRKNVGGKRHEVSLGYAEKEKRKAEAAAAKVVSRLWDEHHGLAPKTDDEDGASTFGEWAERYVKVFTAKKSRPSRDEAIITWWKAVPIGKRTWATTPLDAFKPSDCEAALAHRRAAGTLNPKWTTQREAVSEGTVQRERGLIQAVFERAVDDGLIDKNPWRKIEKEEGAVRQRLLLADEEEKIRAVLQPQWNRLLTLFLETGLRLDEARKIEPRDIGPSALHVHGKGRKRRTLCGVCGRLGGKCRSVPLTTKAKFVLEEQMAAPRDHRLTSTSKALWPQHEARIREVFAKAAERAKVQHLSPHDLRHSFGHRWLVKGGDIYVLSRILGHSSVAVTSKHYAALLQTDLEDKMLAIMQPAGAPTGNTNGEVRQ